MSDVTVQVTIGDRNITDVIHEPEIKKKGLLGCLIESATRISTSVKAHPEWFATKVPVGTVLLPTGTAPLGPAVDKSADNGVTE